MQNSPFFDNLAILFSEIVIFYDLSVTTFSVVEFGL